MTNPDDDYGALALEASVQAEIDLCSAERVEEMFEREAAKATPRHPADSEHDRGEPQ